MFLPFSLWPEEKEKERKTGRLDPFWSKENLDNDRVSDVFIIVFPYHFVVGGRGK